MRILIIEDAQAYQDILARILKAGMGDDVEIVFGNDYVSASDSIQRNPYDLITVDLELPYQSTALKPRTSTDYGKDLLKQIKDSEINRFSPRVVISSVGTVPDADKAFRELNVYGFIDKERFTDDAFDEDFLNIVKSACFKALVSKAQYLRDKDYVLSISSTDTYLTGLEIRGADRYQGYLPRDPFRFDVDNFSKRGDRLNLFFTESMRPSAQQEWRQEARSIGQDLYDNLSREQAFIAGLNAARNLPTFESDLKLRFVGPRASLEVPYELLYDGNDYLALKHPLYRQVLAGPIVFRKVQAFSMFLSKSVSSMKKLRILLIASNLEPKIDAVDEEISAIYDCLRKKLVQIGIEFDIELLTSETATYERVEEALNRCKFHLVHYAGHGKFSTHVAERSSLFFRSVTGHTKEMTASTLKLLLQDSETYLFFLSCCLGARTADRVGRGDFLGIMDSILQADIPAVLGYRWVVSDVSAKELALAFYEALLSNLSIEDALFQARKVIATRYGRDDETWSSPILALQTPL